VADSVDLTVVRGEDFVCQIFWTDNYGEPIPVTSPVEAAVRDEVGQGVLRFIPENDPTTQPQITYNTQGFFQLTLPASRSWALYPGVYAFDLWASVVDSAPPFAAQRQQVIQGTMTFTSPVSSYTQA
jgi:hypothetical protein